jgi:predicted RND superfamily exporter protein
MLRPSQPPTLADLVRYPDLCRLLLPRSALVPLAQPAHETLILILLKRPLATREEREAVITAIRARLKTISDDRQIVTLTGIGVVGYDTEMIIRRDILRLAWAGGGLVGIYLLLAYRNLRHALLAFVPMVFGILILLAVMRGTGIRFNVINLIVLPLVSGLGVDYGVFCVSAARAVRYREGDRAELISSLSVSAHAVTVCALATALGFGSLVATSTPAIASVGTVLSISVAACWLGTVLLTIPTLLRTKKCRGF